MKEKLYKHQYMFNSGLSYDESEGSVISKLISDGDETPEGFDIDDLI